MILSFEGLRGVAAVLVMFFHLQVGAQYFGIVRNGYLAVDLFFVLSGYVIAQNYAARLADGVQFNVFIIRRFGRLWPLHIATTLIWLLAANLLQAAKLIADHMHPGLPHNPVQFVIPGFKEVLSTVTMTQGLNVFDYLLWNIVNWTISDEFYVYILFGAVCLFAKGALRLALFALLAVTAYAFAVYHGVANLHCIGTSTCFDLTNQYGWLRCITGFFIGAILYAFRDHRMLTAIARSTVAQVIAAVGAVAILFYADTLPGFAFAAPLLFAFLVISLSHDLGPVAALLKRPPFQYLGRLSYSIYLMQGCVLPFVTGIVKYTRSGVLHCAVLVLFIGVTIFLARYTYRFIEVPFRDRFNALSRKAVSNPGSGSAAPAGTAGSEAVLPTARD